MTRWLFNVLVVFSLLLCTAVAVLWVRSYGLTDQFIWTRGDGTRSVGSARGCVIAALYWSDRASSGASASYGLKHGRDKSSAANSVGGFTLNIDRGSTHV